MFEFPVCGAGMVPESEVGRREGAPGHREIAVELVVRLCKPVGQETSQFAGFNHVNRPLCPIWCEPRQARPNRLFGTLLAETHLKSTRSN